MAGKQRSLANKKYFEYICECGKSTEYSIYRWYKDNSWHIDSCCGNCNAASNIKFCPFCGQMIEVLQDK